MKTPGCYTLGYCGLVIAALSVLSALFLPPSLYADTKPFDSSLDNTLYQLAKQNDPAAQYLLGRKFFTGSTVERNIDEAIKWFKLAAAQNHPKAQFQLGKMYLYGEQGVSVNHVYALGYLRDAAANNYAEAKYELGNYYLMGKADDMDYAEALKWYRAAADQQHVRAMVAAGKILYEGKGGINPRPDEARHYFSLAAQYGDADAIQALRKISNHNPAPRNSAAVTAFDAKLNRAASDHLPSQYQVGMAYLKGHGVDINAELAAKWLRRAAVNDYSRAQYMLSHLYRDGVGVRKDRKRALEWLQIAASAGVQEAQKELQSMHLNNSSLDDFDDTETASVKETTLEKAGVASTSRTLATNDSEKKSPSAAPKSRPELKQPPSALAAAKLDVPHVDLQPSTAVEQFRLANRYLSGDNIEKDVRRAAYWFEQAAIQNNIEAQYQLGQMYKNGVGVTASAAKAKYWLSKASDAGYAKADVLLKDLPNITLADNFTIGPPRVIPVSINSSVSGKSQGARAESKTSKTSNHDKRRNRRVDHKNNSAADSGKSTSDEEKISNPIIAIADNKVEIHEPASPQKAVMIANLGKDRQTTHRQTKDQQTEDDVNNELIWLIEMANNNNEEAQLKLADMYFTGQGVHRDVFAAARWYQNAANLGNAQAQFKLGDLYKEGLGVEKNNAIAIMWYRKAANQGHEQAKRRLGGCRIC